MTDTVDSGPRLSSPDTHRWKDIALLLLAGIALCVESALLLGQMRVIRLPFGWGMDEGSQPVIGQVLAKSRSVNSRSVSSLTWYPMIEGDKVHVDDTVMTGDDSQAVIKLGHDEEIVLQPHTLVRFTRNQTKNAETFLSFDLNQGTVRIASHSSSRVRVRVPSRDIELKADSEAVVTAAPLSAQADVRVDHGQVEIAQAPTSLDDASGKGGAPSALSGPVVQLKSGEAARLSPGRGLAKLDTHLSITAISPVAKARVQALGDYGNVHFQWEGARAEAVEWDETSDFSSPHSARATGIEAQAQVKPGHYFWRVRQSIATSEPREFTVLPRPRYRLIEPLPGSSVKPGAPIALQWEAISDATSYTLQVSDRSDFSHILREENLDSPGKELPKMKPGKYYWRVSAQHREWGRLIASEGASFVVPKKRAAPPKPKGVKVLPAKAPPAAKEHSSSIWQKLVDFLEPSAFAETAPSTKQGAVWMDFEWEPSPDATRYRLEVSLEQSFRRPVARLDVSDTHAVVELPDQLKFFWRLASIDDEGELGPFTDVQVMERSRGISKEEAQRRIAEAEKKKAAIAEAEKKKALAKRGIASADPAAKKEAPKEPARPRAPFWHAKGAKLGYGASYIRESQSNPNYTMSQSGLPLNQFRAGIAATLSGVELEMRASLQRFLAQVVDGKGQGDLRYTNWGAEFLFPSLLNAGWAPGISVGMEGDFSRDVNGVSIAAASKLVTSVLYGPRWSLRADRTHDFRLEVLGEISPLGGRKGAGLIVRSLFAFPHLFSDSLAPALELSAHPTYRLGEEADSHSINLECTAALSFTWLFAEQGTF